MSTVTLPGFPARLLRGAGGPDPCCARRPRSFSRRENNRHAAGRNKNYSMRRSCVAWLLATGFGFIGVTQAVGGQTCKPALAIKEVRFSPMQPPTLERRWTAIVEADASRCSTTAGYFEIGFSRLKENGIEIEFREQFIWSSPSVMVGVDFWADEAVESHWIDSVQACPCAK
jgi:hypothetical protein